MLGTVMFGGMLALMLLGVPILFAIGIASALGILTIGASAPWIIIPASMFNGMNSFPLMAIPFFVLAGELMNRGGISRRLVSFAVALVGHVQGGLGHANVVANAMLAAVSGSALANIAAVGRVMIPEMEKKGYEREFATGITISSSLLGPIIPPSITMVVYAVTAGASIGGLFLAGVLPGILMALLLMAVIYIRARKMNYPVNDSFTVRGVVDTGREAIIALLMPVIILGGIFGGIMTPTEAAAVAVAYALIVGLFVFRELKLKDVGDILANTGILTGFIMLIVGAARVFSDLLAQEAVPQAIAAVVLSITSNEILMLLLINLLLLVVGCLMDTTAAIIILVPILLPIATELGIDPLLFGVMMCINLVIGLATPPVGIALYLGADVANLKVEKVIRATLPFLIVQIGVLLLVTFVPAISLTLPRLMGY
ncbi:TRAP transporter large permease [Fodinicurvata sp. EGI_FJ10296]|uniref:TRAP transporter large permease n=1 Tax=Fodinicurvata sp. EGI_FJ10296 TaxID=3231908 RepID=UPI003452BA21